MNITNRFVALAVGASILTGVGGTAFAAKAKAPTVAQVTAAVGLVVQDSIDEQKAWQGYYLDQMQAACKSMTTHVTAAKALARPKTFPKASWTKLMTGLDGYQSGAETCIIAMQQGIDAKSLGHSSSANGVIDAAIPQYRGEWSTANGTVNTALQAATKKH